MNHFFFKVSFVAFFFGCTFLFISGDARAALTIQPAQGPLMGADTGYTTYPDLQFYSPHPPTSYNATYNYGCKQQSTGELSCHRMYPTENVNDMYDCGDTDPSPSNLADLGPAWLFNNCVFTGDTTAPSSTDVVPTAMSASQIDLFWPPSTDSGSGISFYRIFRFQGACCAPTSILPNIDVPATQTTYSHTGLLAGTSYGYYVLAYDNATIPNYSGSSGTRYATTFSDGIPPTNPTGLLATAVSISQINLTWNASTDSGGSGLAGYRVERCTGAGCTSFIEIATSPVASYSNTGLSPSTTYRYQVRAYDNAGNMSGYSTPIAQAATPAPPDTTPPTPAPVLSGSAFSSTRIDLSWTASSDPESGIVSYRIERNGTTLITLGSAVLAYSDMSVTASTAYTYRVFAINGGGLSTASNTINISTPAAPDIAAPIFIFSSPAAMLPVGTTFATLAGTTDESATCRYSTTSGLAFTAMTLFSSDLVAPVINHSQIIPGLTDGTLYTYYVKCRDASPLANTNTADFSYMFQVDSPAPDLMPPIISSGVPPAGAVLAAGTTNIVMSVVTNENAYCRYNSGSDIAFALMTNALNSTDFQNHSVSLTGLTNGSSYLYYIRCQDTPGGNVNTSGYAISFSVAFPANVNPIALITATPTSGTEPLVISADGSASYDTDGSIANYIWNWGDSSPNTTGVPSASHTYSNAGTYTLQLTVIDNQGGSGNANQTIAVAIAITPPPPPVPVSVCTAACTYPPPACVSGVDACGTGLCPASGICDSCVASGNICGPAGFCIAQGTGVGPTRFDGYLSRLDGSMSQPTPAVFPAGTTSVIMSVKTDVNADCQYSTFINTPYGASVMKTFSTTGTTAHAVALTGLTSVTAAAYDYYVRCRDLATDIVNDADYTISFTTNAPNVVSGPNPYTCLINSNFVRSNIPYLFDICIPK